MIGCNSHTQRIISRLHSFNPDPTRKPNVSSPLDKPRKSSYTRNMNFSSVFTEARCRVRHREGIPALVASAVHDSKTGLGGRAYDQTHDDETLATTSAGRAAHCCHFTGGCPGVLRGRL